MLSTFLTLLAGHAIADYPLQGDYLATMKRPRRSGDWWIYMAMHALIHGGIVAVITGTWWLGIAEAVAHFHIDWLKAVGSINFRQDQAAHVVCKVVWTLLLVV